MTTHKNKTISDKFTGSKFAQPQAARRVACREVGHEMTDPELEKLYQSIDDARRILQAAPRPADPLVAAHITQTLEVLNHATA